MKLSDIFAASSDPNSLGNRFRNRRFAHFEQRMLQLPSPLTILDIGGTVSYWENRNYHLRDHIEITLVNRTAVDSPYAHIKGLAGDATDLSQFPDKSFDIVFSNSVIEHLVTPANQKRMAEEIIRLGKYYYVQTPNRYFPLEPHFMLPFFQFMPFSLQYFLLTKTKLSRMKRWKPERAREYIQEIRLMGRKEFHSLFPGSKLFKERAAGMAKSYVVYTLPDPA